MQHLSLELPTMYGDHHVIEVRNLLQTLPGIDPASVFASAAWRGVELHYDPAQITPEAIHASLAQRGYTDEHPGLPPVGARAKFMTEFASAPGAPERFVEHVADWRGGLGPCPGFEVLNPGDVHPADK